ncbi:unnamed protein product [Soboliphyme baturini]|uniref:Endo/exonuclease/phosphatase domain-containing protein n=1 Tax=Soboliphyme baturini TaxID=241478 RepID=A0A183JB63_9BILA|nr:unnamed protein product [Soboliphyme baturini]
MTVVKVGAPNLEGEYEAFLEELQCALSEVPNTESLILMGDFNEHVGVDAENCNGEIGKTGPSDLRNNGIKYFALLYKQRTVHYEHLLRASKSAPSTGKLVHRSR